VTIEVTLAIDPVGLGDGQTTATIAARLLDFGGLIFSWTPEFNGAPARAKYRIATESDRDCFALKALQMPGVSLAT
jgi:hypothetical protein